MALYSIGQFSRITGLSIKTIRLYHEKGLLEPALVDEFTNYRYFNDHNVERARAIAYLRELEFPLADIQSLLCEFREDTEILPFLEKQKGAIQSRIRELSQAATSLDQIIRREREVMTMLRQIETEVQEKEISEQTIIGRTLLQADLRVPGTKGISGAPACSGNLLEGTGNDFPGQSQELPDRNPDHDFSRQGERL